MEHLDILQSQGESHSSFHIIHLLRKKASHTTRHCSVQKNLFTSHSSNFSHPPFMPLLPLQSLLLCVLHPVTVVCFSFRIMDFCSYRSLTSKAICKTNEDSLVRSSFLLRLLHLHSMCYLLSLSTVFCNLQCSISAFLHQFLSAE